MLGSPKPFLPSLPSQSASSLADSLIYLFTHHNAHAGLASPKRQGQGEGGVDVPTQVAGTACWHSGRPSLSFPSVFQDPRAHEGVEWLRADCEQDHAFEFVRVDDWDARFGDCHGVSVRRRSLSVNETNLFCFDPRHNGV